MYECFSIYPVKFFILNLAPYGAYKSIQIEILIAIIVVSIIIFLIILLCLIMWFRNSKRRHKAFLIRCTELKHHFQQQNEMLLDPGLDYTWQNDSLSGIGTVAPSVTNMYSKLPPVPGTLKSSAITSSGRSKYEDDVMRMRRNTLTDMKEAISRPKVL